MRPALNEIQNVNIHMTLKEEAIFSNNSSKEANNNSLAHDLCKWLKITFINNFPRNKRSFI